MMKRTIAALRVAVGCERSPARRTVLLYVSIPEQILPVACAKKYAAPLDPLLKKHSLGKVSGGGAELSRDMPIPFL